MKMAAVLLPMPAFGLWADDESLHGFLLWLKMGAELSGWVRYLLMMGGGAGFADAALGLWAEDESLHGIPFGLKFIPAGWWVVAG